MQAVVNNRNIPWMLEHKTAIIMGVTYSLQPQPNQTSGIMEAIRNRVAIMHMQQLQQE